MAQLQSELQQQIVVYIRMGSMKPLQIPFWLFVSLLLKAECMYIYGLVELMQF